MRTESIKKHQAKVAELASELGRLEEQRDAVLSRPRGSGKVESQEGLKDIVAAFHAIAQAERRRHVAKRLLARAQGDEYEFISR